MGDWDIFTMSNKLTNVEKHNNTGIYNRFVKRFFDFVTALLALIILSPVFAVTSLAIKLDSKGPVIFKQKRIGKNGKVFNIYKFRSMCVGAEGKGSGVYSGKNDARVTKVGKFIRATSIDELPQFVNVLVGDMSLIGTRPPTVDEFEQYSPHYRRRLSITPGLTGLWQVSGRSDITDFDEVVNLDLEYIDNWSLTLDFKILVKTFGVVLRGSGSK